MRYLVSLMDYLCLFRDLSHFGAISESFSFTDYSLYKLYTITKGRVLVARSPADQPKENKNKFAQIPPIVSRFHLGFHTLCKHCFPFNQTQTCAKREF